MNSFIYCCFCCAFEKSNTLNFVEKLHSVNDHYQLRHLLTKIKYIVCSAVNILEKLFNFCIHILLDMFFTLDMTACSLLQYGCRVQ